jgi:hypothetical protein
MAARKLARRQRKQAEEDADAKAKGAAEAGQALQAFGDGSHLAQKWPLTKGATAEEEPPPTIVDLDGLVLHDGEEEFAGDTGEVEALRRVGKGVASKQAAAAALQQGGKPEGRQRKPQVFDDKLGNKVKSQSYNLRLPGQKTAAEAAEAENGTSI